MRSRTRQQHVEFHRTGTGLMLRDMILGGQDGLVNVLGIILGVAVATTDVRIVIIAGLVATFVEWVSMAAVAYTSTKAEHDFYRREYEREIEEIEQIPEAERREIHDIYYQKGFRGKMLDGIVKKITSNKKIWADTMMSEELHLHNNEQETPLRSAAVVGFAAFVGSLIPLMAFFFIASPVDAMITSFVISIVALFVAGYAKGRLTVGSPGRSGIEMVLIALTAAFAGYVIGWLLSGMV